MRLKDVVCGDSVLIACVGNYLRMDDAAGLEVCKALKALDEGLKLLECEYGLENCLDEIVRECPRRLVVIDAVIPRDPGSARPGEVLIAGAEDVVDELMVSTHNVPLNILIKYLRSYGCCGEVFVVGIVAKNLGVGEGLSEEVSESVNELVNELASALRSCRSDDVGG